VRQGGLELLDDVADRKHALGCAEMLTKPGKLASRQASPDLAPGFLGRGQLRRGRRDILDRRQQPNARRLGSSPDLGLADPVEGLTDGLLVEQPRKIHGGLDGVEIPAQNRALTSISLRVS
jgi:hypothetical protein